MSQFAEAETHRHFSSLFVGFVTQQCALGANTMPSRASRELLGEFASRLPFATSRAKSISCFSHVIRLCLDLLVALTRDECFALLAVARQTISMALVERETGSRVGCAIAKGPMALLRVMKEWHLYLLQSNPTVQAAKEHYAISSLNTQSHLSTPKSKGIGTAGNSISAGSEKKIATSVSDIICRSLDAFSRDYIGELIELLSCYSHRA